jgi:uncharacterized protein (TIGR01777 family)
MIVAMTGATGFIGRHLSAQLRSAGHDVRPLRREWSATELDSVGAVIHLAGETVAQRWTASAKQRIRSSRIEGTRSLVSALGKSTTRPVVLLAASAVGIYGSRGDEILTETSSPGSGFLADLTKDWEAEAGAAESLGIRVVNLRFGVVLGRDGGALPKMVRPFRIGVGGPLGSGRQWMPWIHIEDAVSMIAFALDNTALRGPLNVAAPNPVTNREFTRRLAAALHRPGFAFVPGFVLRLILGEMSGMVLGSARVLPGVAEAAGFRFRHPDLASALRDLCERKGNG